MDLSPHTLGMLTLGASQIVVGVLTVLFLFCSVLLILTVLIQRPQGGGLAGAFGGGGGAGGETAFGARTGDALTMATIAFFVIWLAIAVGLVWVMTPDQGGTGGPPAATSDEGLIGPGDTDETATEGATEGAAEGDAADSTGADSADQGDEATDSPAEPDAAPDSTPQTDGDGAGIDDGAGDGADAETTDSTDDTTGGGGR
ncbi:MAG: preprotein translocase subunit SecG [Planctomycetota bacterium]|nr:preprotein translocase subunit SecG [Planctomycetota bacterium]